MITRDTTAPDTSLLPLICAEGLPEEVLAGIACAAPDCRKALPRPGRVIGFTFGGREIRVHDDCAAVLEPVQ